MIQWWQGLALNRKIGVAAAVAAMAALIAGAIYWIAKPDFVPISAGGSPDEIAATVTSLEAIGAQYKVDPGTGSVLVSADARDQIRSKLSQPGGTLKSPPGFEVFNGSDFGMTEFSQRINYERGLEGELTRTIMALDGVRFARVHLVLPDATIFHREAGEAKASVTLMTQPDHPLSEAQIGGIRGLVAAAVPGLKPEAVSIHDNRGVDLGPSDSSPGQGEVFERVRDETAVEDRLAAKVYGLLSAIFPPGAVAVSVDVRLRMDKVRSSREESAIEAPKSTELSQLRSELSDPHPDSAGSSKEPVAGNGLAALAVHADAIVHRGTQFTEQVEGTPGAIEQISVGVLVPQGLPPDMSVDRLQDLIASAVGADVHKNDRVAIVQVASLRVAAGNLPGTTAAPPSGGSAIPTSTGVVSRELEPRFIYGTVVLLCLLILAAFVVGRRSTGGLLEPEERRKLLDEIRENLLDAKNGREAA